MQRQVDVFISTLGDGRSPFVLVLYWHASVPRHLQCMRWCQLAITSISDPLLGDDAREIEIGLVEDGYALMSAIGMLVPPDGSNTPSQQSDAVDANT